MIRAFTDGACKSNGKANAQASYAGWFPENKEWSFATKMPEGEAQTNQRAELKAIHDTVKILYEKCPESDIEIYTDSTYSKNCLTSWLPSWSNNNWKTSDGKDVKHRDLIEETSIILTKFKSYSIKYVRAHTGNTDDLSRNNDIVDKMATKVLCEEVVPEAEVDGWPLSLMGPPVEESVIIDWVKKNMDSVDRKALDSALLSAFEKTAKKNGYTTESQVINKKKVIRLTKGLIKEGITIIKE